MSEMNEGFFDSWRATSAVIKSNSEAFLRGNNLM